MRQLVPIRVRPSRTRFAWIAVMAVALWTIGGPPIIATGSGNGTHEQLEAAENVLARMLEAQENLTSFDLPATARVYVGGRKVLTASIRVSASRPNHVAVRWLGMTIHPRKGLIFVDPEQFVSGDYTLAVLASPDCLQNATQPTSNPEAQLGKKIRPGGEDSKNANRWIVSAVSVPGSACPLRWTLYVDPDTWLIVRAEVITPDSDRCVIEAKYRQAGYRRWEPLSVYAEGSLVLQEFLPDFLASLILGHATQGTPACVHLEFSTG